MVSPGVLDCAVVEVIGHSEEMGSIPGTHHRGHGAAVTSESGGWQTGGRGGGRGDVTSC